MSRLDRIGVKVVSEDAALERTVGNVLAIANEIGTLLTNLANSGQGASIDLRNLPMAPGDYEILRTVLGKGEVSAVVLALGPTRITETAVRGVWWVTHHNSNEEVVAEFIEVALIPEILKTHPDDVRDGLALLRARLAEFA